MEKEILIVKNISREGPGLIEEVLKNNKLKHYVAEPEEIAEIKNLDTIGALIVLGGPASANDSDPRMKMELDLIRKVINAKIPYLGICLGLQTMVKAMGGQVVRCETKEVGFRSHNGDYYNIILTPQGRIDSLFKDLPDSYHVFQLHGETVSVSSEMILLASGDICKNQVVKIGDNAYGIQCHFELTEEMLELWIREDHDLKKLSGSKVKSDFSFLKDKYSVTGRQLFLNFLRIAGFVN